MSQRPPRSRRKPHASAATVRDVPAIHSRGVRLLPIGFLLLLLAITALPGVSRHATLMWSCLGAAAALLVWYAAVLTAAQRHGRTLRVKIDLRRQHYMQACAQGAVYLYWGWYWREVYDAAPLIAAQLAFAYAFDMLLTWTRSDDYTLGFGPFPVIFSTNLFLWFKPDWFYLQFLMVAAGFAAKALIQWTKEGRRAHIFNPSSFTLSLFSVALLATGGTDMTWGPEIATTQLMPPHMYLLIFLVALPGQFLFGVASMTLAAVATTLAFSLAYFAATGVHFFFEPSVPIAVFLGMHLLFTDPSTAPRSELGRLLFGMLYGASVIALYAVLGRAGVPTFYDKLLAVPLLNLAIQGLDRVARSRPLRSLDPSALGRGLTIRGRHLAYIAVWAVVFAIMQALTGEQIALARADVYMAQGRNDEAMRQYADLVRRSPGLVAGHTKLGLALLRAQQAPEAVATLRQAIALQPDNAELHNNLALALMQAGQLDESIGSFRRAVEIRTDYSEARYNLAQALAGRGDARQAADELRETIRLRPEWPLAMGALAWLQATQPEIGGGTPEETLALAMRAADLTHRQDASILDALAAAFAAAGRFPDAVTAAEQAAALAATRTPHLVADIQARLTLYRQRKSLVTGAR